jgi:hypothetical protein
MRVLNDQHSLFEKEPNLVKEWHPTANGKLTPTKVKINYPKSVWWICSHSHEWTATIKARINGAGCPVCNKKRPKNKPLTNAIKSVRGRPGNKGKFSVKESKIIFDSEFSDTFSGRDARKSGRFKSNGTAIIEIPATGHWFYAQMKNFSAGGMYFETEAAIRPQTPIKIKFDKPLFLSEQKNYPSTVRWCKPLDDEGREYSGYGLGVKFN